MNIAELIAELRAEKATLDEVIAVVEGLALRRLKANAQKRRRFSAATRQKAAVAKQGRRTASKGEQRTYG